MYLYLSETLTSQYLSVCVQVSYLLFFLFNCVLYVININGDSVKEIKYEELMNKHVIN